MFNATATTWRAWRSFRSSTRCGLRPRREPDATAARFDRSHRVLGVAGCEEEVRPGASEQDCGHGWPGNKRSLRLDDRVELDDTAPRLAAKQRGIVPGPQL